VIPLLALAFERPRRWILAHPVLAAVVYATYLLLDWLVAAKLLAVAAANFVAAYHILVR